MMIIPSSGKDIFEGSAYQVYAAIQLFLNEIDNPSFISLVNESPRNQVEDVNLIFDNKIKFVQIKKRDQNHWTPSEIRDIIYKFFENYQDPSRIRSDLNLPDYKKYKLEFQFITDGDFNKDLTNFIKALSKFQLKEFMDSDEEANLNLFQDESFGMNVDFLSNLVLLRKHQSSSNLNDNCETIKKICIQDLKKKVSIDDNQAEKIIDLFSEKIKEKSRGEDPCSRTLVKRELFEIISKEKGINKQKNKESYELKLIQEVLTDLIFDIEDDIVYEQILEDENSKFLFKVPIQFKLNKHKFFVIFAPQKITQTLINDFLRMEVIITKDDGIPMFLFKKNMEDHYGLESEHCLTYDKETIQQFLQSYVKNKEHLNDGNQFE